jgi:hypothetical protein
MSTATPVSPPPDGSPQIASSPDLNFEPESSSQKFKSLPELMSTTTRIDPPPDGSLQIASSLDESHPSSSWVPTDSDPRPQPHVSPPASSAPGSSQGHVPSPPNLGDHLPSDSNSLSSGSSTEEYHPSSSDHSESPTDSEEYYSTSSGSDQSESSIDESRPPTPDNYRPPRPKRPRPEEHDAESFLSKIPKGKLKRRFSGSGALNAAQKDLRVPLQ